MSSDTSKPRSAPAAIILALALDAVFIALFVALGRGNHAREATFAGLLETAWPFLAGLVVAWAVALVWRAPFAVLRSGLPVWLGTVAIGMLLRALTGGGVATAFVLVALGMLGALLVGWRLIAALIRRLRRTE